MEEFLNIDKVTFVDNEEPGCEKYCGKVIEQIYMENDVLRILFTDGELLSISDEGQSCCETRYMHCEDEGDFDYHKGAVLRGCSTVTYGEEPSGDVHETAFFNILTSKGVIQLVCHNEHNGYYGGFSVQFS